MIAISVTSLLAGACDRGTRATREDSQAAVVTSAAPPSPADSAATLAWFEARAAAIDRDSGMMQAVVTPIVLGAGSTGRLTAWRTGPVWRRLRVENVGAGFRTMDEYWLADGRLLGVRLQLLRAGTRPEVDRIWFHGASLYRWTDAAGRHLNPEARSTQYEVRMLRARFDSAVAVLAADAAVRR